MKKVKCAFLVLVITMMTGTLHSQVQNLAGQWKFRLDADNKGLEERWFDARLPDSIELPGSCEERGFGIKNTVKDPFPMVCGTVFPLRMCMISAC